MRSDNFRLIAEVAKRRSLWDTNMAMSCRKDEFVTQWACVAHVMQLDVMTCKKRFKTMRDSYRAEVRKIQQKRLKMSHWPYFRSLEFLREIFDPQCLVPFPPEPFDVNDVGAEQVEDFELSGLGDFAIDVDVDLDNDDSVDFEIIDDIFKRESAERQDSGSDRGSLTQPLADCSTANKLPISDPELSPRLLSPLNLPPNHASLPRPPPPSKRCRRRKTSSSCDGPISSGYSSHQDTLKTTVVVDAAMKEDSDYSFLVSLMPHLKSLSNMNKLKFRLETSRLLMELNKEEMQPQDRGLGSGGLPRLTPAPDSSFASQLEKSQYHLSNSSYPYGESHNGSVASPSSSVYQDISMIECDVKIENEPLL